MTLSSLKAGKLSYFMTIHCFSVYLLLTILLLLVYNGV